MLRSLKVLVLVAMLVALFGAFHPVLDAAGLCDLGNCPEMTEHSSSGGGGFALACIAVIVPATGFAAAAFAPTFLGRRMAHRSGPYEIHLSLDPPPPRLFSRV